jgi:outer membrane protein assembly factor BamE (lipoprotein component of BamABCDE complex)
MNKLLFVIVFSVIGFLAGRLFSYDTTMDEWKNIKEGMTKEQVLGILGSPRTVTHSSISESWYYKCKGVNFIKKWDLSVVAFDKNNTVDFYSN